MQKSPVSGEVAPPAGDLSEEVDEAQVSGAPPLREEEGYEADSESNPEDSTRQEEGSTTTIHIVFNCTVYVHIIYSRKYLV